MKRLDLITKAINIAITQNSHDMIMTGDELRVCAQALVAAFELRVLGPAGQLRLEAALERAGAAESALRRLVDECENENILGWEDRMIECIDSANKLLSAQQAQPERRFDTPESHIVKWSIPVDPNNFGERLAQPDHPLDKKADNARELGLDYEPEPFEYWNAVEGWVKIDEIRKHFDSVGCGTIYKTAGEGRKPLYTAPVSKPWVSLTELERCNLFKGVDWDTEDWGYLAYARAIEAACREKNGRTDSHTGGGATGSGRAWANGGVDES